MDYKSIEACILPILERRFNEKHICDIKVNNCADPGNNFTGAVYSVTVMMGPKIPDKNNHKEIKYFVLKCYPENKDRCEFMKKCSLFKTELLVYQDLIPELMKFQQETKNDTNGDKFEIINPFPEFIVGHYDASPNDEASSTNPEINFLQHLSSNYVFMADICKGENYQMVKNDDRVDGLDFNHCKIAIEELAKIHALSFAYMKKIIPGELLHERFPCLEETIITPENKELRSQILNGVGSVSINMLEKELSSESDFFKKIKKFDGQIMHIMSHFLSGDAFDLTFSEILDTKVNLRNLHAQNKNRKLKDDWYVFCQGDFWASNIMYKYSEQFPQQPIAAKVVDFQLVRENCISTDLIFFFYTSTTYKFRCERMSELLQIYYTTFKQMCAQYKVEPWSNFSYENLLKKISKAKLWGSALGLLALSIIYSGGEEKGEETENSYNNSVFEGVGRASTDNNNLLVSRLIEIFKEVADEGLI